MHRRGCRHSARQSVRITEDRGRTCSHQDVPATALGQMRGDQSARFQDVLRSIHPVDEAQSGCLRRNPPGKGHISIRPGRQRGNRILVARMSWTQGPRLDTWVAREALCWDHQEATSVLGQQGRNQARQQRRSSAIGDSPSGKATRSSRIGSNCSVYSAIASAFGRIRRLHPQIVPRCRQPLMGQGMSFGEIRRLPQSRSASSTWYTHPIPDDQQLSDRALSRTR